MANKVINEGIREGINKEIREAIAAKVSQIISEKGYLRVDVAAASGIPTGSITQVLNGSQGMKVEQLIALCNGLDVSLLEIIDTDWLEVDPVGQQRKDAVQTAALKMQSTIDELVH